MKCPHCNGTGSITHNSDHMPERNGIPTPTQMTQLIRSWLCKEFKRPPDDFWTYQEESTLCDAARRPNVIEELAILEDYRGRNGRFFPQSIKKLLAEWQTTLDQARNFQPKETERESAALRELRSMKV